MNTANHKPEDESLAQSNDYLWDGSGTPDPELQKLEVLLGKFRHNRPTPVLPESSLQPRWAVLTRPFRSFPALAAAAAVVAAIAVGAFLLCERKPVPVASAGWDVSTLAGAPRIGPNTITENQKSAQLAVGQVLETDNRSRASLHASAVGQIEMDPGTRLRLLTMAEGLKRIALDHGTIHAYIWAPAGQFVVDTPAATTVDLGCAYILHVDDSGSGLLRTTLGWVGFKLNGHESFIPAGAACATKPHLGPGTPYFEDASPEFRAALARFDFEDSAPEQRAQDLSTVLVQSRPRDKLSLWHLLSRVDPDQRGRVFDRLKALAPPPAGVKRDGILRLDQPMLDLWWNALGFDDISVWRHWEHTWSATPPKEK